MSAPDTSARVLPVGHPRPAPRSPDYYGLVVDLVREISLQTDPMAMISVFRKRTPVLFGGENSVSLSRRDLSAPYYRITRSTRWKDPINPWKQKDRLPLLKGGLLAELVYGDEPRIMRDVRLSTSDPAHEYLEGTRSLVALPLYDEGVALNMVVRMSSEVSAFDGVNLANAVLVSNLFGRATHQLVVAQQLRSAYAELDHEMKRVAEIQRSLLPPRLPEIPGLDLAVSYKTATRAGGDYYDFFDLQDGRWGLLVADVSGHGAPAAVVMAMLRTMLRARCFQCATPAELLGLANRQLCDNSDAHNGSFVTAFYGVMDPLKRTLRYACAGHHPPLLVDPNIEVRELDQAQTVPLGLDAACHFPESEIQLARGDSLLLYTDGITDAVNQAGERYGRERLLSCVQQHAPSAQHIVDCVTRRLLSFTAANIQEDDQTLVAVRVV